ncbi:hypothetical protein KQX54_014055 [Cotesia glomerata]|uniref:Uncharacterized protein n=1 Tax=Cotesia glomerata TaxID=32391 RepID=A0AAV7HK07_COTGL|nr:hypothetical protein KQX54_014055 [Cotesia glomerata]
MMGSVMSYEMIIPEDWYMNFSKHQIFNEILHRIKYLQQNGKEFEGSEFTIGEFKTNLSIFDVESCWCFTRKDDISINAQNYFFSGNLINEMFPDVRSIYAINQQRRNLQIMSFNLTNMNLINDDDGFYEENRLDYLNSSEGILQYNAIIPKEWLARWTLAEIVQEVNLRIATIMRNEGDLDNAMFTIAGQTTILKIVNDRFYWWFKKWNHDYPKIDEYHFTDNVLINYFHELIIEKMDT